MPVTPAPVTPAPVTPAPVTPAPTEPKCFDRTLDINIPPGHASIFTWPAGFRGFRGILDAPSGVRFQLYNGDFLPGVIANAGEAIIASGFPLSNTVVQPVLGVGKNFYQQSFSAYNFTGGRDQIEHVGPVGSGQAQIAINPDFPNNASSYDYAYWMYSDADTTGSGTITFQYDCQEDFPATTYACPCDEIE